MFSRLHKHLFLSGKVPNENTFKRILLTNTLICFYKNYEFFYVQWIEFSKFFKRNLK